MLRWLQTDKTDLKECQQDIQQAADFELPAGIQDVRLHDLRWTVESWLARPATVFT